MKRISTLVLLLGLLVGFATGCSEQTDDGTTAPPPPADTNAPVAE